MHLECRTQWFYQKKLSVVSQKLPHHKVAKDYANLIQCKFWIRSICFSMSMMFVGISTIVDLC